MNTKSSFGSPFFRAGVQIPSMSKILITGPTGCIGAATVSQLIELGADEIVGFSRSADRSRLEHDIELVRGDIADAASVRAAVQQVRPTHIIHLAAFQTPDCQSQPFRGLDINVAGTIHLFQAAAELDSLERLINASSSAVYGPRAAHPAGEITVRHPVVPGSMYSYWKICGEGIADAFHMESGVPTLSLRLATTYGPGRDAGYTSAPTTALKAAALGLPFALPYRGREHYHYVHDVAAGFAQACLANETFSGSGTFNLRGQTADLAAFLELANQHTDAPLTIPDDAVDTPFVYDLENTEVLATFPDMPLTPLADGIAASIAFFKEQAASGTLSADDLVKE